MIVTPRTHTGSQIAAAAAADVGYFLTTTFATSLGAPLGDAHPRLKAWYERVQSRPAVAKELAGLVAASARVAAAA